ncbi:MAG: multidrug efflux RND transporter permease subunit [Planctomycetaceae bacterium]|nr:multidrug efflux RND transporter permease subunit [Planctomycetaceae bacterium]
MISRFCIDRPIFAAVMSIVISLAGAIAVVTLPIAQYPDVTPPTVIVTASYPGANAEIVRDTVAAPIEQQVNGVQDMMYMSSESGNDGSYQLTITFNLGTDLKMAQVLVQNRVALALPLVPELVQKQGVSVKKTSPSKLMIVNLVSEVDPATGKPRYSDLYLSNYATIQIRDELARLSDVGDVTYMGQRDYSMRVWLDPDKLSSMDVTTNDVVRAIQQQNIQIAAGQVGQQPAPEGQQFQLTINTLGRLVTVEQFQQMIVKVRQQENRQTASVVRLSDVARLELGAQQYGQTCTLDGRPSVALSIFQLPGSNAIKTAKSVEDTMERLKERFPEGLDYRIVYDTTPFIQESIGEVFKAFRDALILVAIVMLVFLQNWRAALIPLVAVPVAILGTFAVMAGVGFSLNNLSLFGLVLAIGIVVDDAIVVVENVERWLEKGLAPKEAARRAMDEVSGAIVAVALVLAAVFVPCAFISGITGEFFRQFAITIAVSTVISAFNSLTLSPALAALLLKPKGAKRDPLTWLLDLLLGWFFKLFNLTFGIATNAYTGVVRGFLRVNLIVLIVYAGLLVMTYWTFVRVPTGFVPQQDKGYLLVNVQLPDAASLQRTEAVMNDVQQIARKIPGVKHTVGISGQSVLLNANAPSYGSMYVMLDDFSERLEADRSADAIGEKLRDDCQAEISEALISVFGAPPIDGLGVTAGYRMMIEDKGDLGTRELQEVADKIVDTANEDPGLAGVFCGLSADAPWVFLDIDRTKCEALGIATNAVFSTLQVNLGSYYVNNFNEFGRSWQVNVMADSQFRNRVSDIEQLYVRNRKAEMVPLATLMSVRETSGPVVIRRYNMYPSAAINGQTAAGTSSGQAVKLMEAIASETLPDSMSYAWTDLTYMQLKAGNTAIFVFGLSVLFVFLVLAALYESWLLPLAVILVVPMCLLCSVVGVEADSLDVNIFTQIGFVVLVGLASKNAILIVEFARQQQAEGASRRDATLEACRLRLRPILMTSFAFILGVVPLMVATGAGAEMRYTLGTSVFAGMLGVTIFGIFLTPVFYYVIMYFKREPSQPDVQPEDGDQSQPTTE